VRARESGKTCRRKFLEIHPESRSPRSGREPIERFQCVSGGFAAPGANEPPRLPGAGHAPQSRTTTRRTDMGEPAPADLDDDPGYGEQGDDR
jgi:hypothetical protein